MIEALFGSFIYIVAASLTFCWKEMLYALAILEA
jgi:hypothetical protein